MVSDKKTFVCFSLSKYIGANVPRGGAIFDPSGMIRRIYVKLYITMLRTKYTGFGSCGFRDEEFSCISHYKTMPDNDAPCAETVWTPGLAKFIKRATIHCYTQNIKALGLVGFLLCFPIVSIWELMSTGLGPFFTPGA